MGSKALVLIGVLGWVVAAHAQTDTRDIAKGAAVMPSDDDDRAEPAYNPIRSARAELPIEEQVTPPRDAPEYIPFLWKRGLAAHGRGAYAVACADFDALLTAGADVKPNGAVVGRGFLECARRQAEQHDVAVATQFLDKARVQLGEVPEMAHVYGVLARQQADAALARGALDEAIAQITRARQVEPDVTSAVKYASDLTVLARRSLTRGDRDAAQKAIAAALALVPIHREATELKQEMWLQANLLTLIAAGILILVGLGLLVYLGMKLRTRALAQQLAVANVPGPYDTQSDEEEDDEVGLHS